MTIPEVSMNMEDVGVVKIRTAKDCVYLIHLEGKGLQITQLSNLAFNTILVEQCHPNQLFIQGVNK